jgi:hypothetical protein
MAELCVVSKLLAEDIDARIPEERWREVMKTLENGDEEGLQAAGTIGGMENTSNTANSTSTGTNAGTTNTVPNTDTAINSVVKASDGTVYVFPPPGAFS